MSDENAEVADDLTITGETWALRRVHHTLVKPATGEPDRSVFKNDPGGIGTSVTLWLSEADLEIVIAGKPDFGVIAIKVSALRNEQLGIMYTPEEGNANHCEVFGPRSGGKQRRLRAQAKWVKYPNPFPEELKGPLLTLEEALG